MRFFREQESIVSECVIKRKKHSFAIRYNSELKLISTVQSSGATDTLINSGSQEFSLPSDFPTGGGNASSNVLQEKGKNNVGPLISKNGRDE
jgi:hypothetical protein